MLLPLILGLIGVIWFTLSRQSTLGRVELVTLSIYVYIFVGIVVYIAVNIIVIALSQISTNANVLMVLFIILEITATGGVIAISVVVLSKLMLRETMRREILFNNMRFVRPSKVSAAVKLLYISYGMSTIVFAISTYYEFKSDINIIKLMMELSMTLLGGLLIYMIWMGWNWARITYLISFAAYVISVLLLLTKDYRLILDTLNSQTLQVTSTLIITVTSGILALIIMSVALVFLFQKASSTWFKSAKKLKSMEVKGIVLDVASPGTGSP